MARVITTSISDEQWDLCRKNNWKWHEIIKKGVGAMITPDAVRDRMDRMEIEFNALKKQRENTKRIMGWRV